MGMRKHDWGAIQRYVDAGNGFVACRNKFGIAHATWISAITRGDLRGPGVPAAGIDSRRRYDWTKVQAYYDLGHSLRETQAQFGFSNAAWHKAKERGEIRPRTGKMSIEQLLKSGRSRHNVKIRLLRVGLIKNECSRCGLTEWLGEMLSMHIDHINGVKDDHRLENLRMLCPNCHSLTPTYGGRNRKRRRRLQDAGLVM